MCVAHRADLSEKSSTLSAFSCPLQMQHNTNEQFPFRWIHFAVDSDFPESTWPHQFSLLLNKLRSGINWKTLERFLSLRSPVHSHQLLPCFFFFAFWISFWVRLLATLDFLRYLLFLFHFSASMISFATSLFKRTKHLRLYLVPSISFQIFLYRYLKLA